VRQKNVARRADAFGDSRARFRIDPRRTGERYPVTMICAMWRVARATVYARRVA
jgi:hypothetical protein